MYICVCNAITDRDIRHAADRGARNLRELNQLLQVASCCGRCAHSARQVLNQRLSEHHLDMPELVLV